MRKLLKKIFWIMRRSWRLPLTRKLMYVEAFVRLTTAWLLIRLVPYSMWRGLMGQPGEATSPEMTNERGQAIATEIASLHFVVHRVCGTRFTCLMLALSARGMLKVRGIPSELVLGVNRKSNDRTASKLGAHAWVTSCSVEVIGHEGSETFIPVAAYGSYHGTKR
jgi:hypothetical protein